MHWLLVQANSGRLDRSTPPARPAAARPPRRGAFGVAVSPVPCRAALVHIRLPSLTPPLAPVAILDPLLLLLRFTLASVGAEVPRGFVPSLPARSCFAPVLSCPSCAPPPPASPLPRRTPPSPRPSPLPPLPPCLSHVAVIYRRVPRRFSRVACAVCVCCRPRAGGGRATAGGVWADGTRASDMRPAVRGHVRAGDVRPGGVDRHPHAPPPSPLSPPLHLALLSLTPLLLLLLLLLTTSPCSLIASYPHASLRALPSHSPPLLCPPY